MLRPRVSPRIEKARQFLRLGIKACDIWSFGRVAVEAGKRKVPRLRCAAVLLRDNVVDVKRIFGKVRRELAILAPRTRTKPNLFLDPLVHWDSSLGSHSSGLERYLGFRLH